MTESLTLEDCQGYAISRGGLCLSTEYKDNNSYMTWKCIVCNKEWDAKFRSVKYYKSWCSDCANQKRLMELEQKCNEFALSKEGVCISTQIPSAKIKINWKCKNNHDIFNSLSSLIQKKYWCDECGKTNEKDMMLQFCYDWAISKDGKCLSTEYKDSNTHMTWECKEGHQWLTTSGKIINSKTWCPVCSGNVSYTILDCQEFAISKGGKCLSNKYKNCNEHLKWECSEGHQWVCIFNHIKNKDTWCPKCSGKQPHTIDDCQNWAKKKVGKCLSNEYNGALKPLEWECSEGHQWNARFNNIKNQNTWCPVCSGSRSEQMCREIIESYLLEPFPNQRPDFLGGLELDGYNADLKMAFEYNGIQHYEYTPNFHRDGHIDLARQQARDNIKKIKCANYNIRLLIIPHIYSFQNPQELDSFIYKELITLT